MNITGVLKWQFLALMYSGILVLFPGFAFSIPKDPVYPVRGKSETVSLNGTWDFKYISGSELPYTERYFYELNYNSGNWGKINVPSNWEMQGKAEPRYGKRLEKGFGLYRTTFNLSEKFTWEKVIIRFEGVLYAYELYVNGKYVGKWESAFNSCQFDITSFIKSGSPNLLAVKVFTHTPEETHLFDTGDCWSLSGIFRDVVLFSVPKVHFSDLIFRSEVHEDNSAQLNINTLISGIPGINENEKYTIDGILRNPGGKEIFSFEHPLDFKNGQKVIIHETVLLQSPVLWTAETPYLYDLKLTVYKENLAIQSITEKVGIREITIENGILMLNHTPVKLKGVNMHEIYPERGRALTDSDRKKDLELAKKANINFIRTSHYPHHPRFFEMCDSMGFYVLCEIPFNFSPKRVTDNLDYLPNLIERAEATVSRCKNYSSVIIWSVGNENHYAEIYKRVAEYVAEKDPTRPRCFPQASKVFVKEWKALPGIFNVLAPHYLLPDRLDSLAREARRPVIMTEYAHSLGLSTENMEENWEVVRRHPNLAGAAVWMWTDQGIKRERTIEEFLADENPEGVWLDSTTYLDGFSVNGTDGIVYANRYPQADYWLARKVYTPIWVNTEIINAKSGKQILQIDVENRFDFISLEGFYCEWELKHYKKKLQNGIKKLAVPPQSAGFLEAPVTVPDLVPGEFILALKFFDNAGTAVYETTVQIFTGKNPPDYLELSRMANIERATPVQDNREDTLTTYSGKSFFDIDEDGKVMFFDNSSGETLLHSFPVLRVGRKPSITLAYQAYRYKDTFYWNPYLLSNPELLSKKIQKSGNVYEITATYLWKRGEKANEHIKGDVIFSVMPGGSVTCKYDLQPFNATGIFMECGLGFELSADYSTFCWLGDGPFAGVPGKSLYNERDIWSLSKEDIRFNGNRTNTDLAAFYTSRNSGIGFVANQSDFGVELVGGKIIFTNNAFVSGFGTKVNFTKYAVEADRVHSIQGEIDIVALGRKGSEFFNSVIPPPDGNVEVDKPFLKSYGF